LGFLFDDFTGENIPWKTGLFLELEETKKGLRPIRTILHGFHGFFLIFQLQGFDNLIKVSIHDII
jgi:hypothetical protein